MSSRPTTPSGAASPKLVSRIFVSVVTVLGILGLLGLLAVLVMFAFGIKPTQKEVKKEEVKLPQPLVARRVLHGTDPAPAPAPAKTKQR